MAPWRSPRTLVVEPAISVPCLLLLEGFSDAVQISQGVNSLISLNGDPILWVNVFVIYLVPLYCPCLFGQHPEVGREQESHHMSFMG